MDVHAGREAVGGIALFVHALIEQADADDFCRRRGRARHSVRAVFAFTKPRRARSDAPHHGGFTIFNQRLRHGRAGPDLHRARALHLRADPLHELAHRENHAAAFVEKRRRPRQVQRVVLERQRQFEARINVIRRAQRHRAPARAVRVEQVKNFFFAHRRGHRNAGLFNFWKARAQRRRPRDHAGNAEADVVRAFVAKHLRRQSGHDGAFDGGRAVGD